MVAGPLQRASPEQGGREPCLPACRPRAGGMAAAEVPSQLAPRQGPFTCVSPSPPQGCHCCWVGSLRHWVTSQSLLASTSAEGQSGSCSGSDLTINTAAMSFLPASPHPLQMQKKGQRGRRRDRKYVYLNTVPQNKVSPCRVLGGNVSGMNNCKYIYFLPALCMEKILF